MLLYNIILISVMMIIIITMIIAIIRIIISASVCSFLETPHTLKIRNSVRSLLVVVMRAY